MQSFFFCHIPFSEIKYSLTDTHIHLDLKEYADDLPLVLNAQWWA